MVNVDTVYQRVLALANKEQRGYITPQEFNLLANQAQMNIFEQYFYDLNQFRRLPGNDSKYADMVDMLEEKIAIFKKVQTTVSDGYTLENITDLYKISNVIYNSVPTTKVMEEVKYEHYNLLQSIPLLKPTSNRPQWCRTEGKIYMSHVGDNGNSINYIRKPLKINWTYVVVGEKALVNPDSTVGYQDFELHPSEETDLVIKILGLAGITLKDALLYQAAGAEDNKNIQQEKQ
jgi:hypothetical protein